MRLPQNTGSMWAILTGFLALLVYLLTLAPDLTWANFGVDGGELITAAVTLGVPHPPGYPTYVLIGHLFSYLPLATVAYRFNLLSAAASATATAFVVATASQLSLTHLPTYAPGQSQDKDIPITAIAAGLTFAFAPLVWSQAVIAEVYGLNLALVAAFLWALLSRRPPWLVGLLLGLSITGHLTSLLLLPLALALSSRRHWMLLAAGAGLGLSPFILVPVLARTGSPVVWGEPTTPVGWWWLISGRLYHSNTFALPLAEVGPRLRQWSWLLLNQFTLLGLPLLAASLWPIRRSTSRANRSSIKNQSKNVGSNSPSLLRSPALLLPLFATAGFYTLYALCYNTEDAVVLLLPGLLLLSIPLTISLRRLGRLALLLPLASLLLNFNLQNLSDDGLVRPLAEPLLQSAPPDAILLTPGDPTIFAFWYFQHVEGQRPDLILVDRNLFAFDWYRRRLQRDYPQLKGLDVDDLARFQILNEAERPFCSVTLTGPTVGRIAGHHC